MRRYSMSYTVRSLLSGRVRSANQSIDQPKVIGSEELHEDVRAFQSRLDEVPTDTIFLEHQANLLDECSKGITGNNAGVVQFWTCTG